MMPIAIFLIHCAEVAAFTYVVNLAIDFLSSLSVLQNVGERRQENLYQKSEPQPR